MDLNKEKEKERHAWYFIKDMSDHIFYEGGTLKKPRNLFKKMHGK